VSWDVETAAAVHTLAEHTGRVSSVAFSADGKHLVSGSRDSTARLWEVATGAAVRTLVGPMGGVTSVAFSPDGKFATSGSEDNLVWLWDVPSGTMLRTLANLRGIDRCREPLRWSSIQNVREQVSRGLRCGQKKTPKRCCRYDSPKDKVGRFGAR
jgi:WD40 repeat protein